MTYQDVELCPVVGHYIGQEIELIAVSDLSFGPVVAQTPSLWTEVLRSGSVLFCSALATVLSFTATARPPIMSAAPSHVAQSRPVAPDQPGFIEQVNQGFESLRADAPAWAEYRRLADEWEQADE
jgi:hypothetical protein